MSKNVLVISSSLRSKGNSDVLADAFIDGAKDEGHRVEKIGLVNQTIGFCKGCLVCQNKQTCVIKDDAINIVEKMQGADVIAFVTPIYFYEMSGQMKNLLDRSNPLFVANYQFRDIYLLATAGDSETKAMDNAIMGLEGWISCFEKAQLKGVVKGLGVDQYGAIHQHEKIIEQAYCLGKQV